MADKKSGVLGRQPSDLPDPLAIHTRALPGVPTAGSPPMLGPADSTLIAQFFQCLRLAAFGQEHGGAKPQAKVTAELSSLADRVSQMQVTDDERNAAVRRLCNCIRPAVKLLDGEQEAAIRWLKTPNVNLNGNVPVEMAIRSEDEADEVVQLIGRIQYGVFA